MNIWKQYFFPSDTDKDSPEKFLIRLNIDSPKDAAIITRHLSTMCMLNIFDWPLEWKKQISKNCYQLTSGNHRVYYGLYEKEIIIFHICRKKRQQALAEDLNRARLNQQAFEKWRNET